MKKIYLMLMVLIYCSTQPSQPPRKGEWRSAKAAVTPHAEKSKPSDSGLYALEKRKESIEKRLDALTKVPHEDMISQRKIQNVQEKLKQVEAQIQKLKAE